jgi:hypothetical protein
METQPHIKRAIVFLEARKWEKMRPLISEFLEFHKKSQKASVGPFYVWEMLALCSWHTLN